MLQLLSGQFGVVNFALLKPHFLSVYRSSHTFLSPLSSLPPLRLNMRHNPTDSSPGRTFPAIARSLSSVRTELAEGYRFVSSNKLMDAQTTFRVVLQSLLLVAVTSDEEAKNVSTSCFSQIAIDIRPFAVERHSHYCMRVLACSFHRT
jgi:coatomer subunit alpha